MNSPGSRLLLREAVAFVFAGEAHKAKRPHLRSQFKHMDRARRDSIAKAIRAFRGILDQSWQRVEFSRCYTHAKTCHESPWPFVMQSYLDGSIPANGQYLAWDFEDGRGIACDRCLELLDTPYQCPECNDPPSYCA